MTFSKAGAGAGRMARDDQWPLLGGPLGGALGGCVEDGVSCMGERGEPGVPCIWSSRPAWRSWRAICKWFCSTLFG